MNGQGIALVPRLLAEADIAQGRLIELWRTTTPDNHGFYVVCPNTPPPGPAKQAMINWLIGAVG